MLKCSIVSTLRHHRLLLLCMVFLMTCAAFSANIAVFQFNGTRQEALILGEDAADFTAEVYAPFSAALQKQTQTVLENNDSLTAVYCVTGGDALRAYFRGGEAFSAGARPQNPGEILIGAESKAEGYEIGDTLTRNGQSFTVCGVRPSASYDEILPEALDGYTQITELHFCRDYILSARAAARFAAELEQAFPGAQVTSPENSSLLTGLLYEIRTGVWIAGIAACNLLFIFCYILKQKKSVYAVFYLCGARRVQLAGLACAELLSYAALGGVLGGAAFWILLYPRQSSAAGFLWQGLSLSLAVCLVMSLLVALPALWRTFAANPLTEVDEDG